MHKLETHQKTCAAIELNSSRLIAMKTILQSLFLVISAAALSAAHAEDYRSWKKLEAGNVYWYVDESTVSKVANTVFFDGYINKTPTFPILENAARTGVTCDGSAYMVASAPWAADAPDQSTDLTYSLDLRRSIELDRNVIRIERQHQTSTFRTRLAELCRTGKKPSKTLQIVISTSLKGERTLARLNTLVRLSPRQLELWTDVVGVQKFQPLTYNNGEWKPALKDDGSPQQSDELKTTRLEAAKVRYDCDQRKYLNLSIIKYATDGSVLSTEQLKSSESARSWIEVIPDTVGEAELDFLCAL